MLLAFQKTILRTSCIMSTGARHGGDFIIQKYNPPIGQFNPFVRLRGIIFDISKDHYKDFLPHVNTSQT